MHMHTSEASACGKNTIHEMIEKYKSMGFSGAVITNHFYYGNTCIDRSLPWEKFVEEYSRPYYEGQKTARELDFDLLFGIEGNLGGGKEFLVYGVTPEFLYSRPGLIENEKNEAPYRLELLSRWSKEVREAGGILALAHPFRDRAYIKEPDFLPDTSLFDAIEVYNLCNTDEDNEKAAAAFSKSGHLLIAGGDLHNIGFDRAAAVAFPTRVHDENALAEALKKADFKLILPKN